MEWFSYVDDGDLVVPKGVDGFSPSSDSWSQWDSSPFGNFKSEMKRHSIRSYIGAEDCEATENGLSNDVDIRNFGIHEELFDNAASQASYCAMHPWSSYPPEQLNFHLDNLTSIDQLDDVFLSSLLKDCPTGMAASDESSALSTDAPCSMLLDDQVRDMASNSCAATPICEAGVESSTPEEIKDFTASILCHLRAVEGPADKLICPIYYNEFQFIMMSYMKGFLAHLEF